MGEVYRARHAKLGRDVVLKVLPEAFARDAPGRLGAPSKEEEGPRLCVPMPAPFGAVVAGPLTHSEGYE
jgi:hypothetical protein